MNLTKTGIKTILTVFSWGIIYASIILQARFSGKEFLSAIDFSLLFAISVLAGLVLKDFKAIVFGSVGALLFSVFLMFVALTLPVLLNYMPYSFQGEFVYLIAIQMIFRIMFPTALFVCFLGGVLGGFLGEAIK